MWNILLHEVVILECINDRLHYLKHLSYWFRDGVGIFHCFQNIQTLEILYYKYLLNYKYHTRIPVSSRHIKIIFFPPDCLITYFVIWYLINFTYPILYFFYPGIPRTFISVLFHVAGTFSTAFQSCSVSKLHPKTPCNYIFVTI